MPALFLGPVASARSYNLRPYARSLLFICACCKKIFFGPFCLDDGKWIIVTYHNLNKYKYKHKQTLFYVFQFDNIFLNQNENFKLILILPSCSGVCDPYIGVLDPDPYMGVCEPEYKGVRPYDVEAPPRWRGPL